MQLKTGIGAGWPWYYYSPDLPRGGVPPGRSRRLPPHADPAEPHLPGLQGSRPAYALQQRRRGQRRRPRQERDDKVSARTRGGVRFPGFEIFFEI